MVFDADPAGILWRHMNMAQRPNHPIIHHDFPGRTKDSDT
jgi:hypothetical protein